ncbi:MAG: hypothetical protein EXR70_05670 [Deltaproteobacteria bacterium]|nr:hypothetical protein [Deltaproteobacteria bacterium]
MALPDESNEITAPQSATHLGPGTDVLYGWLVDRAAADLGLAQTLAANEAQRREQIKALEESFQAQIRELRERSVVSGVEPSGTTAIEPLKQELERFGAHQAQIEAAFNSKLGEFASQLQQQTATSSSANSEDIKFEVKLIADRIARVEFASQRAQAQALSESQRLENTLVERVQALVANEAASNKVQLLAELQAHGAVAEVSNQWQEQLSDLTQRIGGLENSSSALTEQQQRWSDGADRRMSALVDEVGAQLRVLGSANVDHETHEAARAALIARLGRLEQSASLGVAELKAEIGAIKFRLDEPLRAAPIDDVAVQRLDEILSARIAELQEKLATALNLAAQRDGELVALQGRMSALSVNLTALSERVVDHDQIAALKAELGHGEAQAMQTARSLMRQVEANLGAKLNQLESELGGALERSQSRDGGFDEIRGEIEQLAQRWLQSESNTQQTHGLIANELAHAAQLRDGVIGELSALQSQFSERQERDQRIDNLAADLNARLFDVQNQLSQNLSLLVSRDAEISALKLQVEHLIQMAAAKPVMPPLAPTRLHTAAALGGLKPLSEAQPVLKPAAAQEPASLLQSYDADPAAGAKQDKRQLQEKISADIERVRAELRKRAGVSR